MPSPEYENEPRPNKPLNAKERPNVTPAIFVLLLLAVIAAIFLVLFTLG